MESTLGAVGCSTSPYNMDMSVQTSPPTKKKRKRTIISPDDMMKLEAMFAADQWPSRGAKETLALQLGKSEHFVSIWFQNRRARARRDGTALWSRMQVQNFHRKHFDENAVSSSGNLEFSNEHFTAGEAVVTSLNSHATGTSYEETPCSTSSNVPSTKVMKIMVRPKNAKDLVSKQSTEDSDDLEPPAKVVRVVGLPAGQTSSGPSTSGSSRPSTSKACHTGNLEKADTKKKPYTIIKTEGKQSDQEKNRSLVDLIRSAKKPESSFTTLIPVTTYKRPVTLFEAVVNMMAVIEGGIMRLDDPDFAAAANDAINGIIINNAFRLVYDKDKGLQFMNFSPK